MADKDNGQPRCPYIAPAGVRAWARAARSGSSRASARAGSDHGGWRRRAPARSGPLRPRREPNASPPFRPVPGVRAGLRPTERAPWSSRRRRPATRSRSRPSCRSPTAHDAKSRRTPRRAPTLGSADATSWRSRSRSRPARSTASPCATPSRSRHRITVRHPRVVATQRVRRRRWQQRLDLLPQPVGHPPTIIATHHVAHHDLLIEWHTVAGHTPGSTALYITPTGIGSYPGRQDLHLRPPSPQPVDASDAS